MKFTKTFTVVLILTIIFAGTFTAEAMHGHHHGLSWGTLQKLGLSDAQTTSILGIYGATDIKTLQKNLWQARRSLQTAISQATSADGIKSAITTYLPAVQTAQAALISAKATMAFQIKAVLTPMQLQELNLLRQHE
jgi:Spy/CpxP family protein refolding chaperone